MAYNEVIEAPGGKVVVHVRPSLQNYRFISDHR